MKVGGASREEIMKAFTQRTPRLGGQFFNEAQTLSRNRGVKPPLAPMTTKEIL
jgi:hypothetical protein